MTLPPYSPSSIGTVQRHCPRALDFYQERTHVPANHAMQVGRAAHLAHAYAWEWARDRQVQAVRASTNYDPATEWDHFSAQVLARMVALPDDPVPPDEAIEGIDLMRGFLEATPFSPDSLAECGFAFDRDWNLLDKWDSPAARFRVVFDLMAETLVGGSLDDADDSDDADSGLPFLLIRDFKTGWGASEDMLRSLQMCAYGLCAAIIVKSEPAHYGHIAGIRREIVAVRKGSGGAGVVFADDMMLDDDGNATVEAWKRQITATMDGLDALKTRGDGGLRPAVVGEGCMGCPYQQHCDAFRDVWTAEHFGRRTMEPESDVDRVKLLAVCEAAIDRVRPLIALACEGGEEITLPDGRRYGYCETDRRESADYAAATLHAEWMRREGATVDTFLARLGAIGVSKSEKIVTALLPLKGVPKDGKEAVIAAREELMGRVTTVRATKQLGWTQAVGRVTVAAQATTTGGES